MGAQCAAPGEAVAATPGSSGKINGSAAILSRRDDNAMAVLAAERAVDGLAILLEYMRLSDIASEYAGTAIKVIRLGLRAGRSGVGLPLGSAA